MTSRFGLTQLRCVPDVVSNLLHVKKVFRQAKEKDIGMLLLPENFAFIGNARQTVAVGEPLNGPLFSQYADMCKENKMWASFGGFQEKSPEDGKVYNSHVIVDSDGKIHSVYRKLHLFDVEKPQRFREGDFTSQGDHCVVADTPFGRLGLSVCYDVRFPGLFSSLVRQGAEITLVPAAFTRATGEAHWHPLLRARAIETQTWVLAAAQTGWNVEKKRESFGHALAVDPWGRVTADVEPQLEGHVEVVEVDLAAVTAAREAIPLHHRTDVY